MTASVRTAPPPSLAENELAIPNTAVRKWVAECVGLLEPTRVRILDGSAAERGELLDEAVREGVLIRLNQDKLPGCYLHRSNPNDVARTEQCTFICTPNPRLAGPTNNWMAPDEAYAKLRGLFAGCMRGRTMYVMPFVMGPLGSPLAKVGVQVTDSIYVALNMGIMTRMGRCAWEQLGGRRQLHALPALRRRLRSDAPLHLPFPAGQHHLELRLGLRRQRAAGQEMPGPAPRPASWASRKGGWPSTCCSWA